jgi:hypothetical protein
VRRDRLVGGEQSFEHENDGDARERGNGDIGDLARRPGKIKRGADPVGRLT